MSSIGKTPVNMAKTMTVAHRPLPVHNWTEYWGIAITITPFPYGALFICQISYSLCRHKTGALLAYDRGPGAKYNQV
jgi:hypothetical protein